MNRLHAIRSFGQRIWLDSLSHELLVSGELSRLVCEAGIAGVTSNPTILHKAISQESYYHQQLAELKPHKITAESAYEALVIPDIRMACDLLLPVYQSSHMDDGYVSLEVSPFLAHDTEGTLAEARRLWQIIDRPNLMIKIPATPQGIEALRVLTYEGLNINVTLLFSLQQVNSVWDAYVAGLTQRLESGKTLNHIKAVASFFLSRIDSLLDPSLADVFKGKVAIALSKAAYQEYLMRFHSESFAVLRQAGARPQWLLWASTGTKNSAYSDVLYVESLIGSETINTLPEVTLKKFVDHGIAAATLSEDSESAIALLANVERQGVDLIGVGQQLQREGLALFEQSFSALLQLMPSP